MVFMAFGAVAALVAATVSLLSGGTTRYVPNACYNIGTFLPTHIVGQDLAVNQLVDAVCEHLLPDTGRQGHAHVRSAAARKPLLISVHGPPGVGKTFSHTLLARALYNKDPAAAADCPGEHCKGAKVLYGLSYLEADRSSQLAAVRHAVLEHLRSTPNPLLVVEEYDKLDCDSRALLRQLVRHPELANMTMNRAIVLLESNLGFLELEQMLTKAGGDKKAISPEAAESTLRSVVMEAWRRAPCESLEDTLAFGSAVDFFLPYFPLTRPEIAQLMELELAAYGSRLAGLGAALAWEAGVVAWLVERVDFAGGAYPIEGAKQVSTVCVKHVSRLVRSTQQQLQAGRHGPAHHAHPTPPPPARQGQGHGGHGGAAGPLVFRLHVEPGGRELGIRREGGG